MPHGATLTGWPGTRGAGGQVAASAQLTSAGSDPAGYRGIPDAGGTAVAVTRAWDASDFAGPNLQNVSAVAQMGGSPADQTHPVATLDALHMGSHPPQIDPSPPQPYSYPSASGPPQPVLIFQPQMPPTGPAPFHPHTPETAPRRDTEPPPSLPSEQYAWVQSPHPHPHPPPATSHGYASAWGPPAAVLTGRPPTPRGVQAPEEGGR